MGRDTSTGVQRFFTGIYRAARYTVSSVAFGPDHQIRKYTFLVLIGFGLAGVLIDLDHLFIPATNMARPFHLPVFLVVWIVSIGYYAYTHRRVHNPGIKLSNGCRNR